MKKVKIEKENWFIKALKPTEGELLVLQLLSTLLTDMVDKEVKKGMKPSEALIKSAKEILEREEK